MNRLELLRAYAAGDLAGPERAAFEADLARDPELREMADAYGMVLRATVDGETARAPSLAFEDLRLRAPVRWTRWAAAAAVLLAAGLLFAWPEGAPAPAAAPSTVRLASLPLARTPVEGPDPEWPVELAEYDVVEDGGARFFTSVADALPYARFFDAPVFVALDYPGCPYCETYEAEHFRDPDILREFAPLVIARVHVQQLSKEHADAALAKGWPLFYVLGPDGAPLSGFSGMLGKDAFAEALRAAVADARKQRAFAQRDWRARKRWARMLEDAVLDPPAARWRAWAEVASADAGGVLGAAARRARARFANDALDVLDVMRAQPDEAVRIWKQAEARFAGTPYGADLARVAAHVETYGTFPVLEG